MVQWLRLRTYTAGALVQSLVRELRSHMLLGQKKKYIYIYIYIHTPLVQGKEQWRCSAGAAVKGYSTPKVRETQVRW